MFTGIVQSVQPIISLSSQKEALRVRIEKPKGWKLKLGQSVAIDGVCSTVIHLKKNSFEVEYMRETLRKTTAKSFRESRLVNLERSLTLGIFVDGHLVQGHVDGRAEVRKVTRDQKGYKVTLTIPRGLERYVAARGSVAVNGVSLTIAQKKGLTFTVALIPHTLKTTNLGELKKEDRVNIEVDVIARYLLNS